MPNLRLVSSISRRDTSCGPDQVGGVTIFRLSLALSLAGHSAALGLVAWLGTKPPSTVDQPAPHTIPLIFIEREPSSAQTTPGTPDTVTSEPSPTIKPSASSAPAVEQRPSLDQTPPATPDTVAAEPSEATKQPALSSLAAEQDSPPVQENPEPPLAAPATPSAVPDPSIPAGPTFAPKLTAEEPVPIPARKPPLPPAPNPIARSLQPKIPDAAPDRVSRTPDGANAAAAASTSKPAKPHSTATASAPERSARAARQPPPPRHADPTAIQRYAPPAAQSPTGAPTTTQVAAAPAAAAVALPPPAPPQISAGYRIALSTWLERNKIYPEAARRRGEQGSAILRFRVGRDGRVLAYHLVQSTGSATLDAAVDEMMRGATLPAFPTSMTQSEIAVSVPIRFSLNG